MDDHLKELLGFVVEDVIETGEPVGSQYLVESHELDVSPATIRNWFAELEADGFLLQPHTSAGRVPTEKGYRFYLKDLMEHASLSKHEQHELQKTQNLKAFAKRAAEFAENAVLIGFEDADTFYTGLSHLFAQPEFHDQTSIVTLGEVLDHLDEVLNRIRRTTYTVPTALIGHDCPFGNACGSVVLTLADGTLVGLLGPIRMDYRHSVAILNAVKEMMY